MRLAKVRTSANEERVVLWEGDVVQPLDLLQVGHVRSLQEVLYSPDPKGLAKYLVDQSAAPIPVAEVKFLAPIDRQEVWAAGVTYKRSQVARMQESEASASNYDKVYTAPRPEIFFKATPHRVAGPGEPLKVRWDSRWSVPEPELALLVSPEKKLVGYSIGNDMSARDIEGENPLYLPQAKMYDACCGLGPCIWLPDEPLDRPHTQITLSIYRRGQLAFRGETNLGQMAREFLELIEWLTRENALPNGAFLLTGTGIVPPDDFTLQDADVVTIDITGIGSLTNPIVKSAPPKA